MKENQSGGWGPVIAGALSTLVLMILLFALVPDIAWPLIGFAFVLLLIRFIVLMRREL